MAGGGAAPPRILQFERAPIKRRERLLGGLRGVRRALITGWPPSCLLRPLIGHYAFIRRSDGRSFPFFVLCSLRFTDAPLTLNVEFSHKHALIGCLVERRKVLLSASCLNRMWAFGWDRPIFPSFTNFFFPPPALLCCTHT